MTRSEPDDVDVANYVRHVQVIEPGALDDDSGYPVLIAHRILFDGQPINRQHSWPVGPGLAHTAAEMTGWTSVVTGSRLTETRFTFWVGAGDLQVDPRLRVCGRDVLVPASTPFPADLAEFAPDRPVQVTIMIASLTVGSPPSTRSA